MTAILTDHAAAFSGAGDDRARAAALQLLPSRQVVLLAADWADLVLPARESAYPDDPRPRLAIEAARASKIGGMNAAYAAANAAYAAAHTAHTAHAVNAAYAAANAAYAAANAAYAAVYAASAAVYAANAANAAANAAYAAAAYAAAHAAYAAVYAASAAVYAANAANAAAGAAYAVAWNGVRRLWESAHNAGHVWQPEWATPLARELARDPEAYQILLDHLEDQGVPVEGLRGAVWTRSNWAIYHLLEGKP